MGRHLFLPSQFVSFFFVSKIHLGGVSSCGGSVLPDFQFTTAMLLWRDSHAFPLLWMSAVDLVNHFLLLSITGSGWPLHCRSSMADFQFSCVCAYVRSHFFLADRRGLHNPFRKRGGRKENINDRTEEQTNKMWPLSFQTITASIYFVQSGPIFPNYPSQWAIDESFMHQKQRLGGNTLQITTSRQL